MSLKVEYSNAESNQTMHRVSGLIATPLEHLHYPPDTSPLEKAFRFGTNILESGTLPRELGLGATEQLGLLADAYFGVFFGQIPLKGGAVPGNDNIYIFRGSVSSRCGEEWKIKLRQRILPDMHNNKTKFPSFALELSPTLIWADRTDPMPTEPGVVISSWMHVATLGTPGYLVGIESSVRDFDMRWLEPSFFSTAWKMARNQLGQKPNTSLLYTDHNCPAAQSELSTRFQGFNGAIASMLSRINEGDH